MKWMWLLPHFQIFQQGNLCTLIVQSDPNMFLRRNLCTKICLFVEQHRRTVHSYRQYIQCSPRCFDKILEDIVCKWLIHLILQENHQIFLTDKVCCRDGEGGKHQWLLLGKKFVLLLNEKLTNPIVGFRRCICQTYNPCCWITNTTKKKKKNISCYRNLINHKNNNSYHFSNPVLGPCVPATQGTHAVSPDSG
jgi:hypothetical protein